MHTATMQINKFGIENESEVQGQSRPWINRDLNSAKLHL